MFCENIPQISRNFEKSEIAICAKFSEFRETRNQNFCKFFAILLKGDDFLHNTVDLKNEEEKN